MTEPQLPALLLVTLLAVGTTSAQSSSTLKGPLIRSGGATFAVPSIDFATPLDLTYRVAFDVSRGGSPATAANPGLDSVARFLNLQARAGVPAAQLKLAVVVHGAAIADLLTNEAHREQTGEDNPNAALIEELSKVGVEIIVCGQSAAARGVTKDHLLEPAKVALSAMTAFAVLQDRGYHVNPF